MSTDPRRDAGVELIAFVLKFGSWNSRRRGIAVMEKKNGRGGGRPADLSD